MIQMVRRPKTSANKHEIFARLIHLADALYAERQTEFSYDEVVRVFRREVSDQWHDRTIRRDLYLLVEFGWLEPAAPGRYRVIHDNYPFQRSMSLLESVTQATEEDLQKIRDRMSSLQRELDALKILERAIDTRINGKAPRQIRRTSAAKDGEAKAGGSPLMEQVYDLLQAEGSMPLPAIAARLGKAPQGIGSAVSRCDWFEKRNGEIHIATTK